MPKSSPALRKRQQIDKAGKMMFLWVAGASAIVAIALVGSYFLFQKMVFNEKVLAEKRSTISTLKANNEAVPDLQDNIRVLSTSDVLSKVKASQEDSNLQVVLDALPADGNSLAFGASLQQELLGGIDGLAIESTIIDPVAGVELMNEDEEHTIDATADEEGTENRINFRFTVIGSDQALREALQRLERSIRPISITNVSSEAAGNELRMTAQGFTSYQPARTIELKDKTVKP